MGKNYLIKLRDGLKTLVEDQFKYNRHITDHNFECGTVCCALGWSPKFIPEAGFKWETIAGEGFRLIFEDKDGTWDINAKDLKTVFHVGYDVLSFMFYGQNFGSVFSNTNNIDVLTQFGDGLQSNLQQVINGMSYVIDNFEQHRIKAYPQDQNFYR